MYKLNESISQVYLKALFDVSPSPPYRYIVLDNGLQALLISDYTGPVAPEDEESDGEEEEEDDESGDETEDESEEEDDNDDDDNEGDSDRDDEDEGKKRKRNSEKQVVPF